MARTRKVATCGRCGAGAPAGARNAQAWMVRVGTLPITHFTYPPQKRPDDKPAAFERAVREWGSGVGILIAQACKAVLGPPGSLPFTWGHRDSAQYVAAAVRGEVRWICGACAKLAADTPRRAVA